MQKKINDMNFNEEDISSESDTDSDNQDIENQEGFLNTEEDGIQFRMNGNDHKKKIISREHTILSRVNGIHDRNPNNLFEKEKYIFLPNTEIYKDDYMQLGEDDKYYSKKVFQEVVIHKDSLVKPESKLLG